MPPQMWEIEQRLGITHDEDLWNRVSQQRLLSFIQRSDVEVAAHLSTNNYGEFLFIDLWFPDMNQTITFWGLGYHEMRERVVLNRWGYYVTTMATMLRKEKDLPERERRATYGAAAVKEAITRRQVELQEYARRQPPPSPRAGIFSMLSEVGDEDGAMALMEDFGLDKLPGPPPLPKPLAPKKPPERQTLWDRAMAILRRERRMASPDDLRYIEVAIADYNPAVRQQIMKDMRTYPLFDAVAMWVQPVENALAAYEPRVAQMAKFLIEIEEEEA